MVNFNTAITASTDAFKAGYHTQSPPQVKAALQLSGSLPGIGYLKISIAMPYGKMLVFPTDSLV
ncbi:hypothetical protein EIKCOROL_00573 [Eikenella corrodens ATCC 23834]|uniref:Uncharacterized protein n=1 Tax=Eikenella corrodens ATCC 23834 TaxID=546274 RepID=C0DT96_EIKCO|nr:hypothetical protein EIKCOROL_00573 [Eikenella corrodens ATCC 23834]